MNRRLSIRLANANTVGLDQIYPNRIWTQGGDGDADRDSDDVDTSHQHLP